MSTRSVPGPPKPPAIVRPLVPEAPYPGLEPFRFADSGLLAARGAEVERLVRLVTMYRGVLLYGESGAGKSSIVNAGLLPRLIEDGYVPHRLRVQPVEDQELVFESIRVSWAGDAVLPTAFADEPGQFVLAARTFPEAVEEATKRGRVLLVFDQFEELITLFDGDADALAAQERVFTAIVALLLSTTVPVKLLFVFREDYLASLEPLIVRHPELSDQFLRLGSPSVGRAAEIIRAPFVHYGSAFGHELSEEIAGRVSAALAARSRNGALNLSELQIVCRRLWRAPDPAALLDGEGVEGLLEAFLVERLSAFSGADADVAVATLTRLVTLGGTRNVVSRADLVSQVVAETGCDPKTAEDVLERLTVSARLIRYELRRDVVTYEIVSEFIVPLIAARKAERETAAEARRALERAEKAHKEDLRRRRRLLWKIGGAAAVLVVAAIVALAIYAWNQRSQALHDRDVAAANELGLAADATASSDGPLAAELARRSLSKLRTPVAENALRTALSNALPGRVLSARGTSAEAGTSCCVSFSADGRFVVATVGTEAHVWNTRTGALALRIGDVDPFLAARLSADGRVALVARRISPRIAAYDVATGKLIRTFRTHDDWVTSAAISRDGSSVVAASQRIRLDDDFNVAYVGSHVRAWSLRDGRPLLPPISGKRAGDVHFTRDGSAVIAAVDGAVGAWAIGSGRRLWRAPRMAVAAISRRDGTVAVAGRGGLELRATHTGAVLRRRFAGSAVKSVHWSSDGRVVAAAGLRHRRLSIAAWDATTGRRLGPPIAASARTGADFSVNADGSLVAWAARKAAYVRDVHTGARIARLSGSAGGGLTASGTNRIGRASGLSSLAFSPAGGAVYAAGADGQLRVWNVGRFRPRAVVAGHSKVVWSSAFSPNSDRLAAASYDGTVTVVSVPDGRLLYTLPVSRAGHRVQMVAFSPDGRWIGTVTYDGFAQLWSARNGAPKWRFRVGRGGGTSVGFSRDSTTLVAAAGGRVRMRDVASGRPVGTLKVPSMLQDAVFGAGRTVATADDDGRVLIWDGRSGRRLHTLDPGQDAVYMVEYSHDGRYLAAGTDTGAVVVWDTRTYRQVALLVGATEATWVVTFTDDDRDILAASDDGRARLWDWRAQVGAVVAGSVPHAASVALSPDRRWIGAEGDRHTVVLLRCPGCARLPTLESDAAAIARPLTAPERRRYLHAH